MSELDLYPVTEINFIDEFPLQTEVLSIHRPDALETNKLIEGFKDLFGDEQSL